MITIKIQGGLGNQLFQYATARAIAVKHGTGIAFDLSFLSVINSEITPREFELNKLDIKYKSPSIIPRLAYGIIDIPFKNLIQKIVLFFFTARIYKESSLRYNPFIMDQTCKNTYLIGYFQSEKYFQSVKDDLLQELCFKIEDGKTATSIRKSNSVSLHIRRGDYATNDMTHKIHGLLPLDYYFNSIRYIADRIPNIHIFVFSDDINWSKKNLNFSHKITFVNENTGSESYKDLLLMSICKHNIIANSSFSWWGAWLNQNNQKIVIAPNNWFADERSLNQSKDIIPDLWIRM